MKAFYAAAIFLLFISFSPILSLPSDQKIGHFPPTFSPKRTSGLAAIKSAAITGKIADRPEICPMIDRSH